LSAIVRAEVHGDDRTIVALVPNPQVARKIMAHGRTLRAQRLKYLRVTPSLTVGWVVGGRLGVGFNIVGKTAHGSVEAPQQVYLRRAAGSYRVVADQPFQEW
jgi:lipid-binding SYLF domain-containing protein